MARFILAVLLISSNAGGNIRGDYSRIIIIMLPPISIKFEIPFVKESLEYQDFVSRMRDAVVGWGSMAVRLVQMEAPGTRLKHDASADIFQTPAGAEAWVYIPQRLGYTIAPGTRRHYIPSIAPGQQPGSRAEAAEIQKARGHPMTFYWERVGHVVSMWAVDHPGYAGTDWDYKIWTKLSQVIDKDMDGIWDFIVTRWGGGVSAPVEMLGAGT